MLITAQVPEKKKDSPAPSRGSDRAINEIGVSVKSEPAKGTRAKTTQTISPKEEKKKENTSKNAKKPE